MNPLFQLLAYSVHKKQQAKMGSIVTAEKPTIVLLHGAWHGPSSWDAVASQLNEYQYPFETVRLLSSGGEPSTSVAEDAVHIQKLTSQLADAGKDIILVMHSYAGIPGTESAKGLLKKDRQADGKLGGIVSLVYITAFVIPPGTSLVSYFGVTPSWFVFDVSDPPRRFCAKIGLQWRHHSLRVESNVSIANKVIRATKLLLTERKSSSTMICQSCKPKTYLPS